MAEIIDISRPIRRRRPKTLEQREAIAEGVRRALAEGRGRRQTDFAVAVDRRKRHSSFVVTQRLCERIIAYWCRQGYSTIIAQPKPVRIDDAPGLHAVTIIWEIDTNIGPDGFPPRAKRVAV